MTFPKIIDGDLKENMQAAVILEPGDNVVFEATNLSDAVEDITIDVDWTEIDLEEVEEL